MTTVSATGKLIINPALEASLTINPTTINVGQSVTFTASVTGGTGPYTYLWSNLPSPCSGTSNTISCTPNATGTFNISVQVKDISGLTANATGTLTVSSSPLAVTLTVNPTIIDIGQSITFTATATGGVTPYNYTWSGLPGGCIGTNTNKISCTPSTTGTFNVTITVTDSESPAITNLIQNPGFEIASPINPNTPVNWTTYGVGTPTFSYPQPGRIGGNSVEITYASLGTEAAYLQDIPIGTLDKTKQYILSGYVNTQNVSGAGGAAIQIEWYNDQTYVSVTSTNTFTGTSWTQLSVTIPPNTIPSTANVARVMCKLGNCTGKAWFDDIFFG